MTPRALSSLLAATLLFSAGLALAQTAAAPAAPAAVGSVNAANAASAAAPVWKYKTSHLSLADVDRLLAQPENLLVLDVRRPDELIQYGSFPVFLNIQARDVEKHLAYLPRDRAILTVSNHAQRAGAVGDLLAAKGYTVAGATGAEDYELAGGQAVVHIRPPAPRAAAAGAAPAATAAATALTPARVP